MDAKGLPPSLSKFVFCQYTFWGTDEPVVVAPKVDENTLDSTSEGAGSYKFDHEKVGANSITTDDLKFVLFRTTVELL